MDRKKVIDNLRLEIHEKRSKIEDLNSYIEEAEDNLNTYIDLKEKYQIEIDHIEETLDLMEI